MSNALLRIKQFIDYKKISLRSFELSIEMSNGSFTSQLKNGKTIGVDKLEKILQKYDDLNPDWVLTGNGTMLRELKEDPLTQMAEIYEYLKTHTKVLEEKLNEAEQKIQHLESILNSSQ
jgi:chaperonin cofactor prefoldin